MQNQSRIKIRRPIQQFSATPHLPPAGYFRFPHPFSLPVHTLQQINRNQTRKIAKLPPRTPGIETMLPAKSRRKIARATPTENQAEEFRRSLASQTEKTAKTAPRQISVSASVAALGAIPELQKPRSRPFGRLGTRYGPSSFRSTSRTAKTAPARVSRWAWVHGGTQVSECP
jgi:hypothetical protein